MSIIPKNLSFVAIGHVVGTILQAIFYLVFAILLDPEKYGELSYFIALAGTLSLFARFGLGQSVIIFRAKKNHSFCKQANLLAIIISSLIALILIPINIFSAILCLAFSFFAMNQSNLLGFKKYKRHMCITILKNSLIVTLPILFYFIIDIPGILLGMAVSNFIVSFDLLKILSLKNRSFTDLKNNYKTIIHNFGFEISSNLSRLIDKLLIAPLYGFVFVGIYHFNMQILFALEILPIILYSFLLPEESSGQSHKKIYLVAMASSVLLSLLAILLSPWVIHQYFQSYSEGIFSLQIMVLSIIPLTLSSIISARLQAKESRKIGFNGIIRILSLLGFIALFGHFYGLVGLSLAVLLSIILSTIHLIILHQTDHK